MKETNIYIMKFIEGEKRERRRKLIKRKMIEHFLNLGKGVDIPIHKAQRLLSKINSKKVIPKYITSKSKVKDKKKFFWKKQEKSNSLHTMNYQKTISRFLIRKLADPEGVELNNQSAERNETTSKEYYTQQSSPSEMKEK